MVNQGRTLPDGEYIYECHCGFQDQKCPYCYGGDLERCKEAIKTAKGQLYYGLLKTILSYIGKSMVDEVKRIRDIQGKLAPVDVGFISLKFGLNFKATVEWLEETGSVRAGTYELFQGSKFKVRDVYAAAREKWAAELGEQNEVKQ